MKLLQRSNSLKENAIISNLEQKSNSVNLCVAGFNKTLKKKKKSGGGGHSKPCCLTPRVFILISLPFLILASGCSAFHARASLRYRRQLIYSRSLRTCLVANPPSSVCCGRADQSAHCYGPWGGSYAVLECGRIVCRVAESRKKRPIVKITLTLCTVRQGAAVLGSVVCNLVIVLSLLRHRGEPGIISGARGVWNSTASFKAQRNVTGRNLIYSVLCEN